MICPNCHQPIQVKMGDDCPMCGFVLRPFMQRLQMLYVVSFGFFASTLVYSIAAYFLETRGIIRTSSMPAPLPYILLVVGVLQLGLARRIGPALEQLKAMRQLQSVFIVRLALVEAVAVLGLLTYVLSGSIQWFVTFLAVSWVGFLVVGSQMPRLAQRLAELAVAEQAAP